MAATARSQNPMKQPISMNSPEARMFRAQSRIPVTTKAEALFYIARLAPFPSLHDETAIRQKLQKAQLCLELRDDEVYESRTMQQQIEAIDGIITAERAIAALPKEAPESIRSLIFRSAKNGKLIKLSRGAYWNGKGIPPTDEEVRVAKRRPPTELSRLADLVAELSARLTKLEEKL